MEIFDLKNKKEFLKEVMELEFLKWGTKPILEKEQQINKKIKKYYEYIDNNHFCKLILIDNNKLISFISIFPYDCDEEQNLTPFTNPYNTKCF